MAHQHTNALINSTSPYLLQHAHNPVNWMPWGTEALTLAKQEDKPIILSIGYSSCHWCHVMERESFENENIAKVMNQYFVCIKVDREERPDIDQIYMDALQAMGQNGGWPLNMFLTPNQQPFYGGTYFPPQGWIQLLQQVAKAYEVKKDDIHKSAQELSDALATSEIIKFKLKETNSKPNSDQLNLIFQSIYQKIDANEGGFSGAPKFPMPGVWLFTLRYFAFKQDAYIAKSLNNTLEKMANGGIYDQIRGGFARYSTDDHWLAPHFEKMLYDNGQLIQLYAEAYKAFKTPRYKEVVYQTVEWLTQEMQDENGGFYSALDADSEGVEGKFYTWSLAEIEELLANEKYTNEFITYYNISEEGNWESTNILHCNENLDSFAAKHNISQETLKAAFSNYSSTLLRNRNQRIRPELDDKILASWNALALTGLLKAYQAFEDDRFLDIALKNANFIKTKLIYNNTLHRNFHHNKVSNEGYLEDYALVIEAFINLYESTFDESWLMLAKALAEKVVTDFFDKEEDFFFYTSSQSETLIARKKEIFDNVIPSSNAIMACNLYRLGTLFNHEQWVSISLKMLNKITSLLLTEGRYLYQWATLHLFHSTSTAEIAITGPDFIAYKNTILKHFSANSIICGSNVISELPLLQSRMSEQSTVHVCYDKSCQLPVHQPEEAIKQISYII